MTHRPLNIFELEKQREEELTAARAAERNKVLDEVEAALPGARNEPNTKVHPDLKGHHIGYNQYREQMLAILTNLRSKL